MSTSTEILQALSDHPDGLTSAEIAEFCSSCECDKQTVERRLRMLKDDGVIHAGMRESVAYFYGKPPVEPVNEPRGPALFRPALKALQDERAAALAQIEKLDRAIEALA